jgi:hypothetical protein
LPSDLFFDAFKDRRAGRKQLPVGSDWTPLRCPW